MKVVLKSSLVVNPCMVYIESCLDGVLISGEDVNGCEWEILRITSKGIELAKDIEASSKWELTKDGSMRVFNEDGKELR